MRATAAPQGTVWPEAMREVYWSERVGSWWPGISRSCPHCRGYLDATPPGSEQVSGPGRIVCVMCAREWATVRDRRPRTMTPAEWRDLPIEQTPLRGRPPTSEVRVVRLLERGPMHLDQLMTKLKLSKPAVRYAVRNARRRGYEISCRESVFKLEAP